MADDSEPRGPDKPRRPRRAEREPATLDLKAQRVDETAPLTPESPQVAIEATEPPATEAAETIIAASGETEIRPAGATESLHAIEAAGAEAGASTEPLVTPTGEAAGDGISEPVAARTSGIPVHPLGDAARADGPERIDTTPDISGSPDDTDQIQAERGARIEPEPVSPPLPIPPSVRPVPPQRGVPFALGLVGGALGGAAAVLFLAFFGPFADLPDRLIAVEASVGDKATRRTVDALEKRVQTAEGAAQSLRADLDAAGKRPLLAPGDLTPLNQRLDRLDRAVAQLAARPTADADPAAPPPPLPPVVVAGRESAALAVAMLVRDSVARGTPYGREIAALDASGLQPDAVAKLKPFAAEGAPTPAALAAAFQPLAVALAEPNQPAADAPITDRMSALVARVVRVRPVGNASGTEPGAIGARADAALRRGDLPAALAALDSLPADAKPPVQAFTDRLRARIAAGQAADSLVAAAVDQVIAATANTGVPAR